MKKPIYLKPTTEDVARQLIAGGFRVEVCTPNGKNQKVLANKIHKALKDDSQSGLFKVLNFPARIQNIKKPTLPLIKVILADEIRFLIEELVELPAGSFTEIVFRSSLTNISKKSKIVS